MQPFVIYEVIVGQSNYVWADSITEAMLSFYANKDAYWYPNPSNDGTWIITDQRRSKTIGKAYTELKWAIFNGDMDTVDRILLEQ